MGGVDDQDGVELEPDRARLDAADAGEEQRGQQLLIAGSPPDAPRHNLQKVVAVGVFNQSNQRLDIRTDLGLGVQDLGVRRGYRCQITQKSKIPKPGQGPGLDRVRHEIAARQRGKHVYPPSNKSLPGQTSANCPAERYSRRT